MNGADDCVFHFRGQSSLESAVNEMWKLCKGWGKLKMGSGYTVGSEEFGSDFQHEGSGGNPVTTGELPEISTSAQALLLLLV
jgi:hypothetical protein